MSRNFIALNFFVSGTIVAFGAIAWEIVEKGEEFQDYFNRSSGYQCLRSICLRLTLSSLGIRHQFHALYR